MVGGKLTLVGKSTRKKKKKRTEKTRVQRQGPNPMPIGGVWKKLRYFGSYTVAPPLYNLACTGQTYGANNMYDPDFTGTGHQPRGFDQLSALYSFFTVTNATLTVEFTWDGVPVAGRGAMCALAVKNNGTLSSMDTYIEMGNCKYKMLPPDPSAKVKLQKKVNIAKFLGIRDLLSEHDCRGSSLAPPSEIVFVHAAVSGLAGATNPANVRITATIDQFAKFTEPLYLGAS